MLYVTQSSEIAKRPMETMDTTVQFGGVCIVVPEDRLPSDYGMFVWPSARLLADYMASEEGVRLIRGARVVELGAGTAVAGVAALRLNAARVVLTDLEACIGACARTARRNGYDPVTLTRSDPSSLAEAVDAACVVVELRWGRLDRVHQYIAAEVDVLIAADCFYEAALFQPLCSTLAYLMHKKPRCRALIAHHQRNSNVDMVRMLAVWNLRCCEIHFKHTYGDIKLFQITNKMD